MTETLKKDQHFKFGSDGEFQVISGEINFDSGSPNLDSAIICALCKTPLKESAGGSGRRECQGCDTTVEETE